MKKIAALSLLLFLLSLPAWAESSKPDVVTTPPTLEEQETLNKEIEELKKRAKESEKNLVEHEKALKRNEKNLIDIWHYLMGHSPPPPSSEQSL